MSETKLYLRLLKVNKVAASGFTLSTSVVFVLGVFVASQLAADSLRTDEIFSLLPARFHWNSLINYVVEADIATSDLFARRY